MAEAVKKPILRSSGTRYLLALARTGRGTIVSWLRYGDVGGSSFLIFEGAKSGMSIGYFMEKMSLKLEGDAVAILDFLVEMGEVESYDQ